jgi:predicted ATPase
MEDRELLNNFSNYSVKIARDFQKRSHGECVIDLIDRIKKSW